jgi:ADP-ribosylglycohydrolase/protein-tyrosine phosphatase
LVRTSVSHPLSIDSVAIPGVAGRLGITFCPGKKGDSTYGEPWDRDLLLDVEAIRVSGATALVTLIEPDEFELLEVADLPKAVRAAGLEWHHLPIRDVGVPDASFERLWQFAGARVRARLRSGDHVVVHCRGGLGRAGLVAARILVEFGVPPAEAVVRVRAARKRAIETAEQERYVHRWSALPAAADEKRAARLGVLLAGAIGDALGYRVEFDSWSTIRAAHGEGGLRFADAAGPLVVSDDTQMTLFTLEGLLRAPAANAEAVEEVRRAYLDWYETQQPGGTRTRAGTLAGQRVLRARRAPGNTCLSALAAGGTGTPETPINDSKGCGGVMRAAPVGFLDADDARIFDLGVRTAALTHGHPEGYLPSGAMALITRRLLAGESLHASVEAARRALPAWSRHEATARALATAVEAAGTRLTPPQLRQRLGQGWVGEEALAIGVYAALEARDFADCLELATNHDGDSDSTASIAAQLYAAAHGLRVVPAEAVYRLDVLHPLLGLAVPA